MKLTSAPTNKDELDLIGAKALFPLYRRGDMEDYDSISPFHKDRLIKMARAIRIAHAAAGVQSVPVVATDEMEVADHHGGYPSLLKVSPFYTKCE